MRSDPPSTAPAASVASTGLTDDALLVEYPLLQQLFDQKQPITRESYIAMNWEEPPDPWTVEHEEELPPFLRDWSWLE